MHFSLNFLIEPINAISLNEIARFYEPPELEKIERLRHLFTGFCSPFAQQKLHFPYSRFHTQMVHLYLCWRRYTIVIEIAPSTSKFLYVISPGAVEYPGKMKKRISVCYRFPWASIPLRFLHTLQSDNADKILKSPFTFRISSISFGNGIFTSVSTSMAWKSALHSFLFKWRYIFTPRFQKKIILYISTRIEIFFFCIPYP